jgi:hypothetical protein
MQPLEENMNHTASCIIQESAGFHSRDQITIASGSGVVVSNTVLGRITASKEYAPLDPAASDGSEIAAAVLYQTVHAEDAAARGAGLVRSLDVHGAQMIWPDAITEEQKTAAIEQLAKQLVITR